jgi:hypothetical protein
VIESTRLVYLSIFPALQTVKGSIRIVGNNRLLDFHDSSTAAFPALHSIGGRGLHSSTPHLNLSDGCQGESLVTLYTRVRVSFAIAFQPVPCL